jgi:hypothetical protein
VVGKLLRGILHGGQINGKLPVWGRWYAVFRCGGIVLDCRVLLGSCVCVVVVIGAFVL